MNELTAAATAAPAERLMTVSASPAFWIAVVLYAIAIAALLGVVAGKQWLERPAKILVLLAFVAHGADIGWRGVEHVHPAQSVRESIGFLSWIIVGGYGVGSLRYKLSLAGVVVVPIALALLLVARLSPVGVNHEAELSALGRIHISLATVGVALFALASALAAFYLIEAKNLKRKRFDSVAFRQGGAPLDSLDTWSSRLVWIGFPIFTLSMILGVVWVSRRGASFARLEYPIAAITWLVYAALLVTRQAWGWSGRRTARLTLVGFGAALAVLAIYVIRRALGA